MDHLQKRKEQEARSGAKSEARQDRKVEAWKRNFARGQRRLRDFPPTVSRDRVEGNEVLSVNPDPPGQRFAVAWVQSRIHPVLHVFFSAGLALMVYVFIHANFEAYSGSITRLLPGITEIRWLINSPHYGFLLKLASFAVLFVLGSGLSRLVLFVIVNRRSGNTQSSKGGYSRRPVHLMAMGKGNFRIWQNDPEYSEDLLKETFEITVSYNTYRRPYGIGYVSFYGHRSEAEGRNRTREDRIAFDFALTDRELRIVEGFKKAHSIQGEVTNEGMKDLFTGKSVSWISLSLAASDGDLEEGKRLMDRGVKPDTRPGYGWDAPLIAAAKGGHLDFIRLLLDHGADPGITDDEGCDAHHWFMEENGKEHGEAVRALLGKYGKDS